MSVAIAGATSAQYVGVPTEVALAVRRVYDRDPDQDLPAGILDAAESGREPVLRAYFEWDDGKAAVAHRLSQARDLVRRVKVRVIEPGKPDPIIVRVFVPQRDLPTGPTAYSGAYRAIDEIVGEVDQETALKESILRDLRRIQAKYQHVSELFAEAVAEVLDPPSTT